MNRLIYVIVSLFLLNSATYGSSGWVNARTSIVENLRANPLSIEAKQEAQLYSLVQAHKIISFYEEEIKTNGANNAISFTNYEHGKFNYLKSLIETVSNTYNVIRLISSRFFGDNFTQDILNRWITVLEKTAKARVQLKNLSDALADAKSITDLELSDYLDDELLNSNFIQQVLKDGVFEIDSNNFLPILDDFNIEGSQEFIDPEWEQVLLEQVNILNIMMLVRGPAMVQAFGKTKVGQALVKKLKLEKVIEKTKKLGKPWDSILLWLALETADGCLIRYAYIAYTVGDELTDDQVNEILEYLDKN